MKKITLLFIIFAFAFSSCNTTNANKGKIDNINIELADYSDFYFYKKDISVSEADLKTYLYYELCSLNIINEEEFNIIEKTGITKYDYSKIIEKAIFENAISFSSKTDFINNCKIKIEQNRKWDSFFDFIVNNTTIISLPAQQKQYENRILKYYENLANESNMTLEGYLQFYYEISTSDLKIELTNNYIEFILLESIVKKENILCMQSRYDDTLNRLSKEYCITTKEFEKMNGSEFVLKEYYKEEIISKVFPKIIVK